ncbi:hypothetical protein LOAG_04194 [Loa loa]|uniref:Uncharacterized protein n=1 Tax=Loa loa TaxID=7209 RepID=A0A1S0U2Y5_LOALO|nr:hypothetical protein LOAG_04194 [Loa loa]EFO24297.1 hypothetical protein LOAG_04194 [Loa loa]
MGTFGCGEHRTVEYFSSLISINSPIIQNRIYPGTSANPLATGILLNSQMSWWSYTSPNQLLTQSHICTHHPHTSTHVHTHTPIHPHTHTHPYTYTPTHAHIPTRARIYMQT